MTLAIVCAALLALPIFGLGLFTSIQRGKHPMDGHVYQQPPTHPVFRAMRAHGNQAEYVPTLALLVLLVGAREPALWMSVAMVAAVVSRYWHAGAMLLADPPAGSVGFVHVFGATATYVSGVALCAAAFVVAF